MKRFLACIGSLALVVMPAASGFAEPSDQASAIAAFLADKDGRQAHDFPAWNDFRGVAGDSAAARAVFVAALRADPKLCAAIGGDPQPLATALGANIDRLADSVPNPHYELAAGDIAAVLLVAGRADVQRWLKNEASLIDFFESARPPRPGPFQWDNSDSAVVVKTLLARWIVHDGNASTLARRAGLMQLYQLDDAKTPMALRILRSPGRTRIAGASELEQWADEFAILTAGQLARKDLRPLLTPYLADLRPLSPFTRVEFNKLSFQDQEQERVVPQIRDLALGMLVQLSNAPAAEYGLRVCRVHCFYLEQPGRRDDPGVRSYLFLTKDDRNRGFENCLTTFERLGLDRPPPFTPERPAPFLFFAWPSARGALVSLRASPNGKLRLALKGGRARLIDVASGAPVGEPLEAGIFNSPREKFSLVCGSFSPDGKYVVTGSRFVAPARNHTELPTNVGRVQVWDVATGKLIAEMNDRITGSVWAVGFKSDNRTVYYEADVGSRNKS